MTFTFTLWELVFVCSIVLTVTSVAVHYHEQASRYLWAKRRADALRRSQRP